MTYNEAQKHQNLFNQSYTVHITPYHATSYSWPRGRTHTHTHTHTHAYIRTEVISINQARAGRRPARAWFKNVIDGRKSFIRCTQRTGENERLLTQRRYYLFSKWVNWCQGDSFSSVGARLGSIKLAMYWYLGLVAPISSIVGLLILYG